MPAVIDTPEGVEHDAYALYEEHDQQGEQPSVREAHPGFWRTVVPYLRRQRTPMMQDTSPPPTERCTRLKHLRTCEPGSIRHSISGPMRVYKAPATR
jgi:hypothetical protein